MSVTAVEAPIKFHLSLNVGDLRRAVEFYHVLFGIGPAKLHDDYAKFELDDPPVVFSLVPHPPGPGASLSHLGLRVADDDAMDAVRERLEAAGICTQAQDGTVCGYARQNKCWVRDPDGNFWEVYHIEEDVPPEAVRKSLEGQAARAEPAPSAEGPVAWEHFVTNPVPDRIPHADGTVDEVRLVGTFNSALSPAAQASLLNEAARVLKSGGKVLTHGLMADRAFTGAQPVLPGIAAMVSRVPAVAEPVAALRAAGFVGVQFIKYPEQPWFMHQGVGLREVKLMAWKPASVSDRESRPVLYKGPFQRATADGGRVFHRGERVEVPLDVWQNLRHGPSADHFLFFESGADSACSGGSL